jgi:phosphinothricin acetyltransferase
MNLVACQPERHSDAILAIFNDAIVHSTALYDYQPRTRAMMGDWFSIKTKGGFPVLGLETTAGELAGFASYGAFRPHPAYKYTVEHSVYVDQRFRGQGLGRRLLKEIIATAEKRQYHTMIGVIDSANETSIALHKSLGFAPCGAIRQVGFKFGQWLDIVFYQLLLATPSDPVDG